MNSPREIAQNTIAAGVVKAGLPAGKAVVLGIFAGFFIALAAVGSSITSVMVENPSVSRLIAGSVFPAGLAMVLVSGSELFTGNCLMILPLLDKKIRLRRMLRNWGLVYLGNLIGSVLVASLCAAGHVYAAFDGGFAGKVIACAAGKSALPFGDALIRGILCNVLVCIAVWMSSAAKSAGGRIACLFFPILLFVAAGFEHCVANMYYLPAGLYAKMQYSGAAGADSLTVLSAIRNNLVPVTIGNIIGGVAVAAGYWFVYAKEKQK